MAAIVPFDDLILFFQVLCSFSEYLLAILYHIVVYILGP